MEQELIVEFWAFGGHEHIMILGRGTPRPERSQFRHRAALPLPATPRGNPRSAAAGVWLASWLVGLADAP